MALTQDRMEKLLLEAESLYEMIDLLIRDTIRALDSRGVPDADKVFQARSILRRTIPPKIYMIIERERFNRTWKLNEKNRRYKRQRASRAEHNIITALRVNPHALLAAGIEPTEAQRTAAIYIDPSDEELERRAAHSMSMIAQEFPASQGEGDKGDKGVKGVAEHDAKGEKGEKGAAKDDAAKDAAK